MLFFKIVMEYISFSYVSGHCVYKTASCLSKHCFVTVDEIDTSNESNN